MHDGATTSRVARVPRGLAGMMVILAAVETMLGWCDVTGTTHLVDSWTDARAMVGSNEVRESAILCLGDSQIKQGLLPSVLGDRLGVPAYNLAVHGGQPAAAYMLLRRALDAGARPRGVVVGFFPGLLGSDLRINVRQWPEIAGTAAALDLALTARDVELGTRTLLGVGLRSYRARAQLRSAVSSAVRGVPNPSEAEVVADRRQRRANRGALTLPANPVFVDDAGPAVAPSSAGHAWKPKPENERFLRRFLELARSRGIAVYWVTSTLSPASQAVRERLGLHEGYVRHLRRLQAEYPNLTVLDTLGLGLDRADFHDPCHLEGRAAARLSTAVADAIASGDPGGPRWVRLGPSASPGLDARMARGGIGQQPAR